MSFLQSILTDKQLANVIVFGVTFTPLVVGGLVFQFIAIRAQIKVSRND